MDILRKEAEEENPTNPMLSLNHAGFSFCACVCVCVFFAACHSAHTCSLSPPQKLEVYQIGPQRWNLSSRNECHFLGSKYIGYISEPSNWMGVSVPASFFFFCTRCFFFFCIITLIWWLFTRPYAKESKAATARRQAVLITVKRSQLTYKPGGDVWRVNSRCPLAAPARCNSYWHFPIKNVLRR